MISRPGSALRTLVDGAPRALGADWAALLEYAGDLRGVVLRSDHSPEESHITPAGPLRLASGMELVRGRPGRRSAADREEAVLELMSGKASVDQLARRFGVQPETIEGWRTEALEGMREAMRRGTGRSEREAELEREVKLLRETVALVNNVVSNGNFALHDYSSSNLAE